MLRSVAAVLLFLILPTLAPAQEVAQSQQVTHEVVRGESLWTLAERYYGNPYRWPIIYEANRAAIANPNIVEPGQVLVIPEVGGMTQPTREPDPEPAVAEAQVQGVVVMAGGDTLVVSDTTGAGDTVLTVPPAGTRGQAPTAGGLCPGPDDRTLFFPGAEDVRRCPVGTGDQEERTPFYPRRAAELEQTGPVAGGIPGVNISVTDAVFSAAVPYGHVYGAEWLDRPGEESSYAGTVTGFAYLHNVRSEEGPVRVGEQVIITLEEGHSFQVGDLLQSFQAGRKDRRMGQVLQPTGILVVTEAGSGQIEATVASELGRIWMGDWVRPAPDHSPVSGVFPTPVESDQMAVVLGFPQDRAIQAYGASVFLDLGTADGISIGDVFMATLSGPGPGEGLEAARVQVVMTDENRSTGRIVSLKYPGMTTGDSLRLIAKMN